jgi:site-specific recombinase XerD
MMAPTDAADKSDATRRAYRSDFDHFAAWCRSAGRIPLPATSETIATYLASLADHLKASTINRRCIAIAYAHRQANIHTPTAAEAVKAVLRRIRRREIWRG